MCHLFQSTLPNGSDDVAAATATIIYQIQSTLPNGSDDGMPRVRPPAQISIHAPKRERRLLWRIGGRGMEFQSTLPNGSDEFILWFAKWYNISIHAPKRERREPYTGGKQEYYISIHAPKRERLAQASNTAQKYKFQSTLPNGSDGEAYCDQAGDHNFNPRSQTGATTFALQVHITFQFQSTLPNGSDEYSAFLLSASRISIHAPKRERL